MSISSRVSIGPLIALLCVPLPAFAEREQEARVREYFADIPVMIAIAECESKFTQYGTGGTALHGGMSGKMVGIFQIYGDIHANYALGLGMSIYTTEGNLAYARHLYEKEGTKPWLSSFPCWGSASKNPEQASVAVSASGSNELSANLSFGQVHPQILTLQKILNRNGFVLTNDGPGSPGSETEKYGSLTRDAVRRFQCAQKIVCDGDEHSTGYGFVGPRTRGALLALGAPLIAATTVQPALAATTSAASAHAGTNAATVNSAGSGGSSAEGLEAVRLQAQIEELTKKLNMLLTEG